MKNIEKFKDAILNEDRANITCCVNELTYRDCDSIPCEECKKRAMKWLLEEYKEPILDDAEREYLSAVIKPFRKKVMDVVKIQYSGGRQSIRIRVSYGNCAELPFFKNNTMYKGMEACKYYTPEELGL